MAFNEAQLKAIRHGDGPALILAGPGSGKTTVITNRIRFLTEEEGVTPSSILVITFTRAAATEMQKRYEQMTQTGCAKPAFGTFHSVFFMILKLAYRYDAGSIVREEQRVEFLRELLRRYEIETEDESEFISGVLSEISMVKGEMIGVEHYYAKSCSADVFRRLYKGYEAALRGAGLLDFDDMLVMCRELFDQRADILQAWQRKYRYILIDEFQDINRIQYEVIRMMALPENNLFIVGDDDQSIYRFRGAKPEIMLGFEKDYPGARRVLLAENYRSSREIVEASLKLISRNQVRFKKELVPVHGPGRPVDVSVYENPLAEAEGTARRIRQYAQAGFAFEDMAVLFRTGNGTGLLAEKLMEYNIPFSMRDVIPSLYGHWIAKDLMAYLELGHGSRARSDFFRIMNRPNRYFSRDAFETPLVSLDQVRDFYRDRDWMQERVMDLEGDLRTIGRLRPGPAIHYIRQAVGYDDYLKEFAAFRRIRPEEFFDIASQIEESAAGFSTLEQWKEHIRQYEETLKEKRREAKEPGRPEGVTLSTMHSSKGLEYRIVFVVDANEGIVPHHKAGLPADIEEERRLFYVAMTRAKERLHLCAVKERYHRKQEISRFVKECMD